MNTVEIELRARQLATEQKIAAEKLRMHYENVSNTISVASDFTSAYIRYMTLSLWCAALKP